MLSFPGKFAERLAELRKDRSLTQKQLAEAIGTHERSIRFYEAGRLPDAEILIKLADFFGTSLDYLVGRTDDPSPAPALATDNPDIRAILRAKLTDEQAKKLRQMAELLFPEAFREER